MECPIVPGILPIVSKKQILRITQLCGTNIPEDLNSKLEAAGEDDEAAFQIGVDQAIDQVTELLEKGAPGIHFYVLNRANHMKQIFERLPADLLKRD